MKSIQAPQSVVMIRPHHFCSNPETRDDNAFQTLSNKSVDVTSEAALREFDGAVSELRNAGVHVHVFDDTGTKTPDSVFPNNWFSTHAGGHVAIYPMFADNRRLERRSDVIDYSGLETDNLALEGTGAMVLDHMGRIAYTVKSNRADPVILERFCTHFNFEPIAFEAKDARGRDVYHTNVLMGIGTNYALICLDMIVDPERRRTVAARLEESGCEIIDLTHEQIADFAGNAIELTGHKRRLALSTRALSSLRAEQIAIVEKSAEPLPLTVPTIETAGGSVRCMIAGIHLTRRAN